MCVRVCMNGFIHRCVPSYGFESVAHHISRLLWHRANAQNRIDMIVTYYMPLRLIVYVWVVAGVQT